MTQPNGHSPAAPFRRRLTADDFTREETYRRTRLPVDMATTLLPEAYVDPDFYALEQERVFATSWVPVGFAEQVATPGDVLVATVAAQSIIVTRDKGGELRAFYNVCRHRGAKLLDDDCRAVRAGRIRCPYHSWAYDLTGQCIGTPLFEGSDIPPEQQGIFDMSDVKAFDRADYGLYPVNVDAWGMLVFVNLAPDCAPLAEQLGDLPERLGAYRLDEWRIAGHKHYDIAANYKLIGENFMEYYHLPWVHPELIQVSRMEDHYRWQGPGMYTGMMTSPISQNSDAGGWQGLPPLDSLAGDNLVSARFVWLFPNIAINVLPNHVFIMLANPTAAGQTAEDTYLLLPPGSGAGEGAPEALAELLGFWDLVNVQDIEIVERVQQGLGIRPYDGGRMCFKFEEPLHRYQNMIVDRMVGRRRVPSGDAVPDRPMFAG